MGEQKRKNTIFQIYVPVAGLDVLYCHELDFQPTTMPLCVQAGAEAIGQAVPIGAIAKFHIVNAFMESEDVTGKKSGQAIGQLDIYGTIVVRPCTPPEWWKDVKHEKPGLSSIIKLD